MEIFTIIKTWLLILWWTILGMDSKSINTLFLCNLIEALQKSGKDTHEIWQEIDYAVRNPYQYRWGTIELAIQNPELERRELIELLREEQAGKQNL